MKPKIFRTRLKSLFLMNFDGFFSLIRREERGLAGLNKRRATKSGEKRRKMGKNGNSKRVLIGTSGFYYKNWQKKFYPPHLKKEKLLNYYSQYLKTVEINSSFYRIPSAKTAHGWKNKVPDDFIFSFKASRSITHTRKLHVDKKIITLLFQPLEIFKHSPPQHLMLFQTPSFLRKNSDNLENLLQLLPKNFHYAFEFRHLSWFNNEIYTLLKQYNAALVLADSPRDQTGQNVWPLVNKNTADFFYIRFHGSKQLYVSSYTDKELKHYAKLIKQKTKKGMKVFAYFNNDAEGWAVENAKTLQNLIDN